VLRSEPPPSGAGHSSHAHGAAIYGRKLQLAIILTVAFVAGEALVGWRIRSLALLSDAGHNLSDGIALGLSAFAFWVSRKPATAERTFGYHRVGILTALINALSLVAVSALIAWEAVKRLRSPEPIDAGWMIVTAVAALAVNVLITVWLHAGARDDLNIKSAYLHMLGDALASAGVVVAGVIVWLTGSALADPIISMAIGVLILWSSIGILRESLDILMEAAPLGVGLRAVEKTVLAVEGVLGCHDLHVWTIASGLLAGSCHVVIEDQSARSGQAIAHAVSDALERVHRLTHVTVQVEVDHCDGAELLCTLRPHAADRVDAPAPVVPR